MASEWLTLTGTTLKKSVYVNLANASSIFANGRGFRHLVHLGLGQGRQDPGR